MIAGDTLAKGGSKATFHTTEHKMTGREYAARTMSKEEFLAVYPVTNEEYNQIVAGLAAVEPEPEPAIQPSNGERYVPSAVLNSAKDDSGVDLSGYQPVPMKGYLLVLDTNEKVKSSLLTLTQINELPVLAFVHTVPEGSKFQPTDLVMFRKFSGIEITLNDHTFRVLPEDEIILSFTQKPQASPKASYPTDRSSCQVPGAQSQADMRAHEEDLPSAG